MALRQGAPRRLNGSFGEGSGSSAALSGPLAEGGGSLAEGSESSAALSGPLAEGSGSSACLL